MITIDQIDQDRYKLRIENLVIDLNRQQIVKLRHSCYTAIQSNVVCRCCGTGDLRWKQVEGKWLLFDNDKLHDCPVKPLPELIQDTDKCDWI